MTDIDDIVKLDNYGDEDISDVVVRLEKSFGLKFGKDAFLTVKTFGDLCDIFVEHIKYVHQDGCTKQQAFYKIRTAISETQLIDNASINLETKLADLFPRQNRRTQVKQFQKHIGIDLKFLTYPSWLSTILMLGILSSLIAFFFDWRIATIGLLFFWLGLTFADILGKDLKFDTVKQLTEFATTEQYIKMRRSNFTVNENEIIPTIVDAFSERLDINKEYLTRDAKFSWA